MFQILYGSTAAGLYDQAAKLNAQARTLYLQSSDTYYKANDGALPSALLYLRRCVSARPKRLLYSRQHPRSLPAVLLQSDRIVDVLVGLCMSVYACPGDGERVLVPRTRFGPPNGLVKAAFVCSRRVRRLGSRPCPLGLLLPPLVDCSSFCALGKQSRVGEHRGPSPRLRWGRWHKALTTRDPRHVPYLRPELGTRPRACAESEWHGLNAGWASMLTRGPQQNAGRQTYHTDRLQRLWRGQVAGQVRSGILLG